jgi:hypothetical protein
MDFENMPRSFKNALTQMTGFSSEELSNLAKGKPLDEGLEIKPVTVDDLKQNISDLVYNPLDSIKKLLDALLTKIAGLIAQILAKIIGFSSSWIGKRFFNESAASHAEQNLLPDIQQADMNSGLGSSVWDWTKSLFHRKKKAEFLHSGGIVGESNPSRMVAPSIFAMAPKFHDGLLPDEFPAILQKGEAVIPKSAMDKSSTEPLAVDTANVEQLLKQLIGAVKQQKQVVVQIDGKAVGKVLIDAHR